VSGAFWSTVISYSVFFFVPALKIDYKKNFNLNKKEILLMKNKKCIVITSINSPTDAVRKFAKLKGTRKVK
jgi:hypothetical protein